MILGMSDAFKGCRFLTWGSEPCFHHGIVILPGNFEVMPRRMSREGSLGGMGGGGGGGKVLVWRSISEVVTFGWGVGGWIGVFPFYPKVAHLRLAVE